MSIQLIDRTSKIAMPTEKEVVISGENIGEVRPSFEGDRLRWHSIIRLQNKAAMSTFLVQGFGPSARTAIADGVIRARKEKAAFIERLEWLEQQLGTANKTDEDLARDVI